MSSVKLYFALFTLYSYWRRLGMGLSAQQKTAIKSYFESNFNLFFGIPTERKEGDLTPNEHVMVLQYMQFYLLKLPIERLDEELVNKQINGDDTVGVLLEDFLGNNLSPMNPDAYFHSQKNFIQMGNTEDPAKPEDIIQYLIEVIENMSQQMDHGYLKKESDPRIEKSNSSYASKVLKWGLFGGAALAITYAVSKLSDKNHANSL
ncbi:hypothetical protein [Legionella pneumophila]|nr:hypothetical protein [Legionella pneumophila]AMP88989.2 hypothetical protein AXF35_04510 [Legionella pneumophila subsp. pascullei]HAT6917201.1 hypothetical protein [Legionella pneumophila]HAT6919644.1 hypothetical protein [Legionella pneumophila]HAT6972284.1 hypothetical protein [Legionella pneumophila]HAU3861455.1 hypothetical protein [Legionella pneumophila]